jgi:hypothetical protein
MEASEADFQAAKNKTTERLSLRIQIREVADLMRLCSLVISAQQDKNRRRSHEILHLIAVSRLEHAISVMDCHADNALEAAKKIHLRKALLEDAWILDPNDAKRFHSIKMVDKSR